MRIPLDIKRCRLIKTDGVQGTLSQDKRRGGRALRLDFNFGGSGHALVRVPVSLVLTENYVFKFAVAGDCPSNSLEFKLLDQSTDNVWWVNRPNFQFPGKWQTMVNKKRHFSYAWGPNKEQMKHVAYVDLSVTATSGGSGTVYFSDLNFDQLPAATGEVEPPLVKASSGRQSAGNVLDGNSASVWQSSARERQYLTFDFPAVRELSALVLDWGEEHGANYQVQIKGESGGWHNTDTISGGSGVRQYLHLPDTDIKQLRLVMRRSRMGRGYQVRHVDFKALDWAPDLNAFWRRISADYPAGFFPRYFRNEQSFWTVVGVSGGRQEAIINEEGMIEVGRQTLSVEPFIYAGERLLTWKDGQHAQSLLDGYLPVPRVVREHKDQGLSLEVMTFAAGTQEDATLYARYTLKNTGSVPSSGRLFLALRQFQVNPTWQFLNTPGGFTPVNCISYDRQTVSVDEKLQVVSLAPAAFGATTLSSGDVVEYLRKGVLPAVDGLCDERGFGSGALLYEFDLGADAQMTVDIAVPYTRAAAVLHPEDALATVRTDWQALQQVGIDIPAYPELVDTVRSQLAYILVNRDGPAIQPGSRCYRRTWIRDGALTSAALLQHGFVKEVRDFIEWFAPYQYPSGKVPCCVDKRGSDPVPEHDSHGEFIYLVMEFFRFTGDRDFLNRMFPRLLGAISYIEELRKQTMSAEFQQPGKEHLYGILPPSISHEGYSAHPAYSNWDNIFAMKGLDDAVEAARLLGKLELAWITALRDSFHQCWIASIEKSMKVHNIEFIPGANDLGDFDATSTTIGLDPADRLQELPEALAATFERYWKFFQGRRDGSVNWFEYTPYEWRTVGAMVRLGEVGRAHEALDYFMSFRRPRHWNHWAEVIYKDPLTPRFIGDAPHGWVGSDFLRSVRNLFVYETRNSLILARGIKPEWLDQGVTVKLPTHFGTLSLTGKRIENDVVYRVSGDIGAPVYLAVEVPGNGSSSNVQVEVNGVAAEVKDGLVAIALPAEVRWRT